MSNTYTTTSSRSTYNPFGYSDFDGYTGLSSVYYNSKAAQKRFYPGPSVRRSFKKRRVPPKRKLRKIKAYRKKKVWRKIKRTNYIRHTANLNPWQIKNDTFSVVHQNGSGAVGVLSLVAGGLNLNYPGEVSPSASVPCIASPESNLYYSDIRATLINLGHDPDEDDSTSAIVNIEYIKHWGEVRNNANIACTLRFYKLIPRTHLPYNVSQDSFGELMNKGLSEMGNSSVANDIPLSWTPYDSTWITKNFILKSWKRRLLPGEKCFYSYKVPIPKISQLSKLTKTGFQRWSGVIGALVNGDPAHSATATTASTAPCHLDVIMRAKRKFRKTIDNIYNSTTNTDALSILAQPTFNTMFANEPSAFASTL